MPTIKTDKQTFRFGLMADSHGQLDSITNGVRCLRDLSVDKIIHLGDIFDSLKNDPIEEIFEKVRRYGLIGVKGNNDYQIEISIASGNALNLPPEQKRRILSFLRQMPLRIEDGDICFSHSLPFDNIRSIYEPIDIGSTKRAIPLFNATSYRILFCGHSHKSILFRWRLGKVTREAVELSETIHFQPSERYILIVGAADKGECGIFDKARMTYQRISSQVSG